MLPPHDAPQATNHARAIDAEPQEIERCLFAVCIRPQGQRMERDTGSLAPMNQLSVARDHKMWLPPAPDDFRHQIFEA
jgi:hypothetical protein